MYQLLHYAVCCGHYGMPAAALAHLEGSHNDGFAISE
jgi:hypothetical protein